MNFLYIISSNIDWKKITVLIWIVAIVFSIAFVYTLVPKKAEAFLGIADFNFSTIVVNIPELALEIIKIALAGFLVGILQSAMNWVIQKISKNLVVQNFLKYDAILSDQKYLTDYLLGYFPDKVTTTELRSYIYAYNTGGLPLSSGLATSMDKKAYDYRQFEPADLDPKDPSFNMKMAKLSDPYASPYFWYYASQDQSFKAKGESDKAAGLSQVSEGYKTLFDKDARGGTVVSLTTGQISKWEDAAVKAITSRLNVGGGDGLRAALAQGIANFLLGMLNTLFVKGVFYREEAWPPRFGIEKIAIGDIDDDRAATVPYPPVNLPSAPNICGPALEGKAKTDLGEAVATGGTGGSASGGEGGSGGSGLEGSGGSGGTGGSASGGGGGESMVDLNDGRVSVSSEDTLPCSGYPAETETNTAIGRLNSG